MPILSQKIHLVRWQLILLVHETFIYLKRNTRTEAPTVYWYRSMLVLYLAFLFTKELKEISVARMIRGCAESIGTEISFEFKAFLTFISLPSPFFMSKHTHFCIPAGDVWFNFYAVEIHAKITLLFFPLCDSHVFWNGLFNLGDFRDC